MVTLISNFMAELSKSPERIDANTRGALIEISSALGIELRFCRWCDRPFAPVRAGHFHCKREHYQDDYNKNWRGFPVAAP